MNREWIAWFTWLLFVSGFSVSGCITRPFEPESTENEHISHIPDYVPRHEPTEGDMRPLPGWRPRTHPPGTLLIDTHGDFYMVDNWLERVPTSSDAFAEAGLSDRDAVRMTPTEERCLRAVEPYWWGPIVSDEWRPMIGPDEEEWLVHSGLRLKRLANLELLDSWGFGRMIDTYDGPEEEWWLLREVEPLTFRDGYMLRTERGISYFVHGERWLFASEVLAEEAGYALERIRSSSEDRLRSYPIIGTFTREIFGICPAETPLADMYDRDGDGSPSHRDCNDLDPEVGEDFPEVCDGKDNDCNGITDDPFPVNMSCRFMLGDCRLNGREVCLPDGSATFCDADDDLCDC